MSSPATEIAKRIQQRRKELHDKISYGIICDSHLLNLALEASKLGNIVLRFSMDKNANIKVLSTGV